MKKFITSMATGPKVWIHIILGLIFNIVFPEHHVIGLILIPLISELLVSRFLD